MYKNKNRLIRLLCFRRLRLRNLRRPLLARRVQISSSRRGLLGKGQGFSSARGPRGRATMSIHYQPLLEICHRHRYRYRYRYRHLWDKG